MKAVFRTYCMDYPDYEFYCTLQASRRAIKGLPCVWFAKSDWESGELVLSTLREHDIDFVVLAGFLVML